MAVAAAVFVLVVFTIVVVVFLPDLVGDVVRWAVKSVNGRVLVSIFLHNVDDVRARSPWSAVQDLRRKRYVGFFDLNTYLFDNFLA